MEDKDLWMKEYAEISAQCRWYERMIRMNLNIFIPLESVLIAFVWQYAQTEPTKLAAIMIGLVIAVGAVLSDLRLRDYYSAFAGRGKTIENLLQNKVKMFTHVEATMTGSRTPGHRVIYRGVFVGLFLVLMLGGYFSEHERHTHAPKADLNNTEQVSAN